MTSGSNARARLIGLSAVAPDDASPGPFVLTSTRDEFEGTSSSDLFVSAQDSAKLIRTCTRLERLTIAARKTLGVLLSANFMFFWLIPIVVQGQIFKRFLQRWIRPIHDAADRSESLRAFAFRHIYREPVRVDYFASALFLLASFVISLAMVFFWQIANGNLPWWLVACYYFLWVGFGGRAMGTAYTFAHREGHAGDNGLYRPLIQRHIGNLFENRIGLFYGNVPHNFSTSHVLLHHRFDGGKGDPFYIWDIDRTNFGDLMLYQWRVFLYVTGWSSLKMFRRQRDIPTMNKAYYRLRGGMALYWLAAPTLILGLLLVTGSSFASAVFFLAFVYFQPLLAMSTFLAILNVAFHGFIEYDRNGRPIPCVSSTTIIDGSDDTFGEDDHMTHHIFAEISHDGLAAHQRSQHALWGRHRASVFHHLSLLELAAYVMLGKFQTLAERYFVDFSGEAGVGEVAKLLETRAKRKEMDYADYEFDYLPGLESTVEELVRSGTCKNANKAYIYQARQKTLPVHTQLSHST